MGQRASNTAGVTFEDVVVPNEVGIHYNMFQHYKFVTESPTLTR